VTTVAQLSGQRLIPQASAANRAIAAVRRRHTHAEAHGWIDQQWWLVGRGGVTVAIELTRSRYFVDVPGSTIARNTELQQWPSSGGHEPNQWFYLTPVNITAG
jgi:hypothetical protein